MTTPPDGGVLEEATGDLVSTEDGGPQETSTGLGGRIPGGGSWRPQRQHTSPSQLAACLGFNPIVSVST